VSGTELNIIISNKQFKNTKNKDHESAN